MDCIEKRPGPLRVKFTSRRTPINLCEVDNQSIEKRHVNLPNLPSKRSRPDEESASSEVSELRRLLAVATARADQEQARAEEAIARADAAEVRVAALGNDTTFRGLLDSRLPPFEDRSSLEQYSTKAVGAMVPNQIRLWEVREEMENFRGTLPENQMDTPAKKMMKPGFPGTFVVYQEAQTVTVFVEAAGKALNLLCSLKNPGDSFNSFRNDSGKRLRAESPR